MSHIIFADIESLLIKHDSCSNDPEKSYTERKSTLEACGYSMNVLRSYHKNIRSFCRGKDYIQKFCKGLLDNATKIVNTPKKPITPLTSDEQAKHERSKICHICNEKFINDKEDKQYNSHKKLIDHDHYTGNYRGAAHSICNLRYQTQREIPVVLHNGNNYDFHIIIKELAKEFRIDMKCLGENTEKYISFSVLLKVTNDENKIIVYRLKFIDSMRFMNTSLASLTDNLSEINAMDCKTCMGKNRIIPECQYITHENNKLIYKCKKCNAKSYKPITPLKEKFRNTFNFCNDRIDKFLLLLRKGVCPYDYMDNWERFSETRYHQTRVS